MRQAKTVAGFPTRRPRERPKSVPLELTGKDGDLTLEQPISEACAFLYLPQLAPASFLSGAPPQHGIVCNGVEMIRFGSSPDSIVRKHRKAGLRHTADVDVVSFARMVAKIGYAWSVASSKMVDRARCPVLAFILGQTMDGSIWLGSSSFRTRVEDKNPTHALALDSRAIQHGNSLEHVLIAQVKLFATSGATGYEVVTHRG